MALKHLRKLSTEYKFEDVSDLVEYRHKGDIKATCLATGQEIFIDVKDDSVIGSSRNVLCEEENFWKETGIYTDGFMYSDYDYLAIVSQPERKIYVIDFKILKGIYRRG